MAIADAIRDAASKLGINPLDLGTAISYETAGTFDPWKAGPTTQWGQHRGLIQWGEPQRQRYGVYQGMPVEEQLNSVVNYLRDAGVKPGMGLLDVYSAINAGRVGRYGASDANNGGAPGTVQDKVERQMGGHRQKAEALLGGGGPYLQNLPYTPQEGVDPNAFNQRQPYTPPENGSQANEMLMLLGTAMKKRRSNPVMDFLAKNATEA
ncbi:MAG: hypothetical protein DI537_11385 [Stutzerimonas stutzeri]|nr:MAG: hypothetical protein DI537_11385 [Stutzerimonas stutzeri]